MTFNQINYFITVAQNLNFSRASDMLFVTQSTLSRSIASLESELGVALFDRTYHNLKLTPAGELFLKEGTKIMENMNSLIGRMQKLESTGKNQLSIGILDGQKAETAVLIAVKKVMEVIPEFGINIKRLSFDEAVRALAEHEIDMVQTLVSSQMVFEDYIESMNMDDEKYYLVASDDDPVWEAWTSSDLSFLDGRVLLTQRPYPGQNDVQRWLSDKGILPRVKIVPDNETMSLWLESGMGIALCNAGHVTCNTNVKRPVRIKCLNQIPTIPVRLLWNKENLSPLMELFLKFLQEK